MTPNTSGGVRVRSRIGAGSSKGKPGARKQDGSHTAHWDAAKTHKKRDSRPRVESLDKGRLFTPFAQLEQQKAADSRFSRLSPREKQIISKFIELAQESAGSVTPVPA